MKDKLEVSRAVASIPLLLSAKAMLVAAEKIHGGWGNTGAAIQQCDYAIRNVRIRVGK